MCRSIRDRDARGIILSFMVQESVTIVISLLIKSVLVCVLCVCVSVSLCVGIFWCEMPNTEQGNIDSVVGSEHSQIAHIAGPAVSPMTSVWCGFLENQTSSHSCFHTKPSYLSHPKAFFFSGLHLLGSCTCKSVKLDPLLAAKRHLNHRHLLGYLAVPRSQPLCCAAACLFL